MRHNSTRQMEMICHTPGAAVTPSQTRSNKTRGHRNSKPSASGWPLCLSDGLLLFSCSHGFKGPFGAGASLCSLPAVQKQVGWEHGEVRGTAQDPCLSPPGHTQHPQVEGPGHQDLSFAPRCHPPPAAFHLSQGSRSCKVRAKPHVCKLNTGSFYHRVCTTCQHELCRAINCLRNKQRRRLLGGQTDTGGAARGRSVPEPRLWAQSQCSW